MRNVFFLEGFIAIFIHSGCNGDANSAPPVSRENKPDLNLSENFKNYWYQGKAEICSYELSQARYGEMRKGDAVLVFVTEDFSNSRHIKIDEPGAAEDLVKVLKLNFTKKFVTGIYPYSMMCSVFTPVNPGENQHSLKVSGSIQEWCGQTYTQLDLADAGFSVKQFSYFEDEGNRTFQTEKVVLEDELWTRIRISPNDLPQGEINLLPGVFFVRLKHIEMKPQKAKLVLSENVTDSTLYDYSITYPQIERTLTIHFYKNFPSRIQSWEETYSDGFGTNAKRLTTKGKLKKVLFTDYWTKNHNSDRDLRDSLGLSF